MTKHLFTFIYAGRLAYVLVGWDPKRRGFYMIIDYQNGPEETAIYSNLFSAKPYPKTLDLHLKRLAQLGVELPAAMIHALLQDAFSRCDEKETTHQMVSGEYVSIPSIDYAIL